MAKYFEQVREKAEADELERQLQLVKQKRQAERYLAKNGRVVPFGHLNLADIEVLEKAGTATHLRRDEAFAERERMLVAEREEAISLAEEHGKRAALAAAHNVPPLVAMDDSHEKERAGYLAANGLVDEPSEGALKESWDVLRAGQLRARAQLERSEAGRKRDAEKAKV